MEFKLNKVKSKMENNKTKPYSILSKNFFVCYWIHMRPYLLYISGIAGLTGLALIPEPSTLRVAIAMVIFFFGYGHGQALSDVFQTDTDAISSPYRPLVKGDISKGSVFAVSMFSLVAGVVILAYLNPYLLIPGGLSVAGLWSYTWFKRRWWGGPPCDSAIVALLPIMGRMVDPSFSFFKFSHGTGTLLLTIIAVFFAYANFVVAGYFKDISADAKTNYNTIPVKFGWQKAAIVSDSCAALAIIFTFLAIYPVLALGNWQAFLSFGILLFAAVENIRAQVHLHMLSDESETHQPIATVVRSFVWYSSVIVLAYKASWIWFLILFYVLFEYSINNRPEKTQV